MPVNVYFALECMHIGADNKSVFVVVVKMQNKKNIFFEGGCILREKKNIARPIVLYARRKHKIAFIGDRYILRERERERERENYCKANSTICLAVISLIVFLKESFQILKVTEFVILGFLKV